MWSLYTCLSKMDCLLTILILLAFIEVTCGQTVTVTGPSAVEQGTNAVYTCTLTGGSSSPSIFWRDISVVPNIFIFSGEEPVDNDPKHANFAASVDGSTSTMTITNTAIEDEGVYRCTAESIDDEQSLAVEVAHTLNISVASPLVNNMDYNATCEALEGRPDVTITWMLGTDIAPCDNIVETDLPAATNLSSKRSVCTFQADIDNNNETLRCVISGHEVDTLNGEVNTTLNIHSAPTGTVTIGFPIPDPNLRVSCDISPDDKSNPPITNYYIYSNDTLIHEDDKGVNYKDVGESDFDVYTDFMCVAGNYLGNTTSQAARYNPDGPTIPPTTATAEMTSPETKDTGGPTGTEGLGVEAIIGIVIAVIVLIGLVIGGAVIYKKKKGGFGGSGSNNAGSGKKHSTSAVGSSNGNEKEKIKPEAAPRGHSSIQHTNDNPDHAEYAMVDRTKPSGRGGGDMPDTRGNGAGQNDQGMHYADLDLSVKAGHSERQVPQDKDNVVVYSSILV